MATYNKSHKRLLASWLDNAGQILNLPRLSNESLFDYKQRLMDHVRNRGNTSIKGFNQSLARQVGFERKHILTVNASSINSKPFIEITSKYIRFYNDQLLVLEVDVYTTKLSSLVTLLEYNNHYIVDYYDEDYNEILCKKLFYGNNEKYLATTLVPSKLNILPIAYLKEIAFSTDIFSQKKSSLEEVKTYGDYHVDYREGLIYSYVEAAGTANYTYYEIPFKFIYSPVTFFPLNDKDVDQIIKKPCDGFENKIILNDYGADIINSLLTKAPMYWGE